VFHCSAEATVARVKRRIVRLIGIPVAEQWLVHADKVLKDDDTLAGCCITDGPRGAATTVQCVRAKTWGFARHLEERATLTDPDKAIVASLADVVDAAVQVEHSLSERTRPCAADLSRAIRRRERNQLINWMIEAFDLVGFDDSMLHNCVNTLDRYYACQRTPIKVETLQGVVLSVVCTEMKMAGSQEFPSGGWQHVLSHLCHGRVSMEQIFLTEYEVLSSLGFIVGVPTPATFLNELSFHLEDFLPDEATSAARVPVLALFLLELALFEPELQYGHPYAVLAAGAFSAALRAIVVPKLADDEDAMDHDPAMWLREMLVEDLGTFCPDLRQRAAELILGCERRLLDLWLARAGGRGGCERDAFYPKLEAKFAARQAFPGDDGALNTAAQALARLRQERARSVKGG